MESSDLTKSVTESPLMSPRGGVNR
jgi:hypothetical protein